jgi:hypothetical protein
LLFVLFDCRLFTKRIELMTPENTGCGPAQRRLVEETCSKFAHELWVHLSKGDVPVAPEYLSSIQAAQFGGICGNP